MEFGKSKADMGQIYELDPQTIDTENLMISGELTPDVPIDKMQKINGAVMAVQQLGYAKEAALEEIGVQNPQQMMKDSVFEKLQDAIVQAQVTQILGEAQAKVQAMAQQYQMQIQADMQMQQQANMQGQMMQSGVGGQGFNPAAGGNPAQNAFPEMTREAQNANAAGA